MITPNSESNSSSRTSSQESAQKVVQDVEKCNDDALLSTLKSSELLKHLLSGSTRKLEREDENKKKSTRNKKGGESARGSRSTCESSVSQKNRNFLQEDHAQSVTQVTRRSYKSKSRVNNFNLTGSITSDNNEIMYEKCDSEISEFSELPQSTRCHLPNSEVQPPFNPQPSVQNEDLLPILPDELLENETMDFILAEAQRTLNIQSPSSSQYSHEGESGEVFPGTSGTYTHIFHTPSPNTSSSYSPTCSYPTEINSDVKNSSSDSESVQENLSENASEDNNSSSDSEVDNAMVLVPSGKYIYISLPYSKFCIFFKNFHI